MNDLAEVIVDVRAKIRRYGSRSLNEESTKATLIQPILRALGWNVEDFEDVQLEYRRRPSDKPVDYALMLLRSPCLFVEAKALGQNLNDPKWANQFLGYATVAGVEWVTLTNGDEWRIYNSHAPVPVEEKLFRTVHISDEGSAPEESLCLLSKERIRENEINVLWKAHFVDRQVRSAVEGLFDSGSEPDPSLVRLLSRRVKTLSGGDIKASLRRARLQLDFPVDASSVDATRKAIEATGAKRRRKQTPIFRRDRKKAFIGVGIKDLIEAGMLSVPLRLTKQYRGRHFEAEVLPDGQIRFEHQIYSSCSTAADAARRSVVGGTPHTNGWVWWQYSKDGKTVTLDDARQAYLKKRRT